MRQTNDEPAKPVSPESLKRCWDEMRGNQPQLRIREAAAALQVSEAELLATGCDGDVIRLDADWRGLLHEIEPLGPVLALTRNDSAVHEKTGDYRIIHLTESEGRVRNAGFDLFLDLNHWHLAFAVAEQTRHGRRDSLQFFDRDGTAVHKIYMTENSDSAAYRALTERYRSCDQSQRQRVEVPDRSDTGTAGIDTLEPAWREHLIRCGIVPGQSTGPYRAKQLPLESFRRFMHQASENETFLTVVVGNDGALQLHSGPIHKLLITGPWFNVLDDGFNLHLKETALARLCLTDGSADRDMLDTLELYDADGRNIAMIGGKGAAWDACFTAADD